jgi:hypothetical protein
MSKLAQNIGKTLGVPEEVKENRRKASKRENSTSKPVKSYRFAHQTTAMIEELRMRKGKETGRIPTATEILEGLIQEAHGDV